VYAGGGIYLIMDTVYNNDSNKEFYKHTTIVQWCNIR